MVEIDEMKLVAWLLGGAVALAFAVFAAQWVASETGEVVVLHTLDANGAEKATRIWVVDYAGKQWLRSGSSSSSWYRRLAAEPHVRVERAGATVEYIAVPSPEQRQAINAAMRTKYGWRDSLISWMVGGRDGAIPISLEPATRP